MLDILLLFLIGASTLFVIRRTGSTSAISFFVIYGFLNCLVYYTINISGVDKYYFSHGGIFYSAMPMNDLKDVQTLTFLLFLFLNLMAVIAVIPRRKTAYSNGGRYREIFLSKLNTRAFGSALTSIYMGAFLVLCIGLSIWHFFSMDQDILWKNSEYLIIKTPELVGLDNPILQIYHILLRVIGLGCIVLFEIYRKMHRPGWAFTALALVCYVIFMMVIGNSRWVPLYFFVWAVIYSVLRGKATLGGGLLLFLAAFSFVFVINGRARGYYGISQIFPNVFSLEIYSIPSYILGTLVNIFEGALNVGNSILLAPDFSFRYQLGSLSPFPSFIDHFDTFLESDKAKFALHVPMGGYGEVVNFEIGFQIIYFLVIFFTLILLEKFNRGKKGSAMLILNVIATYVFYLLPTYSARTSWRYLILIDIAILIMLKLRNNSARHRRRKIGSASTLNQM